MRVPGALTPWETLGSELAFDHRWYRVRRETVRLPSGKVVDDYFVSERPDVVLVAAVTPDENVVFVRQWKQGRRAFMIELPGGMCDPGEAAEESARRELLEETGYACEQLTKIGEFEQDPTKGANLIVAFLGFGAGIAGEPSWDEQEELEIVLIPVGELESAVREGRLTSAGTVATVFRALDELGALR
jgi:8-oxo-dGTP pyrophosphatase MutT (NUDIX family)